MHHAPLGRSRGRATLVVRCIPPTFKTKAARIFHNQSSDGFKPSTLLHACPNRRVPEAGPSSLPPGPPITVTNARRSSTPRYALRSKPLTWSPASVPARLVRHGAGKKGRWKQHDEPRLRPGLVSTYPYLLTLPTSHPPFDPQHSI
jgi:hypothetical protein